MTYRSQCDCRCHQPGNESMIHFMPCCEPDLPKWDREKAKLLERSKPRIVCVGMTKGNFLTGEIHHSHHVQVMPDGTHQKSECPTCGFDYEL